MPDLGFSPKSILDIGANVGEWTREARQLWPFAEYFLVEGNPGCRKALEATGEEFEIALLGREAKEAVPFFRCDEVATGASVYRELTHWYRDVEPIMLPQTTLDELLPGREFDFIKLDTQGSELDILAGGSEIVSKARAALLEVSHAPYNQGAPLAADVFRTMRQLGFRIMQQVAFCDAILQGDYLFLR